MLYEVITRRSPVKGIMPSTTCRPIHASIPALAARTGQTSASTPLRSVTLIREKNGPAGVVVGEVCLAAP